MDEYKPSPKDEPNIFLT